MRQAVSLDGSVASQTQTPLGMYGTLTPGEVSAARQGEDAGAVVDLEVAGPDRGAEADPVAKAQGQSAASATPAADREKGGGKG